MAGFDMADIERRMDGALNALSREFGGLRTGRASTSLLEPIHVDAYGSEMPMNQVGTVGAPEPRLLTVQVWDQSDLSEERRIELKKVAGRYAEQARIAVRNVRRDGMDALKRMEKDSEISKDEHRDRANEIQEATDRHINRIDESLEHKEREIMQV
jgi:ribosome recycling factor